MFLFILPNNDNSENSENDNWNGDFDNLPKSCFDKNIYSKFSLYNKYYHILSLDEKISKLNKLVDENNKDYEDYND